MKFYIETHGCYKNRVDSEVIVSLLEKHHRITNNPKLADVIIINTCTFVEKATMESIETILRLAKLKGIKLIVIGCLGQRYANDIMKEIPEVDAVIGTYGFNKIEGVLERVMKSEKIIEVKKPALSYPIDYIQRRLFAPSHYAYIKISDGCNRRCSFCIIPELKGNLRSRGIESIIKEAETLVRKGVKEIILIAQDTTAYGLDIYGKKRLSNLLCCLSKIDGLKWLRLLYNYPGEVDDKLLELIASDPKICKYLDIPIQHISDSILRRMRREISGKKVRKTIMKIRKRYPEIFLRTTIIAGFPGEREEDFLELCQFIKDVRFERLGVFTYSREDGTESFNMKRQIPRKIKEEREEKIMEIQSKISLEINKDFIGKTVPVIIDERIGGKFQYDGRTEFDAPEIDNGVLITRGNFSLGDIVHVKIKDATEYDLIGGIEKDSRGKVAAPFKVRKRTV